MFQKIKAVLLIALVGLLVVPASASASPIAAQTRVCYSGSSTGWVYAGNEIHHFVQFNNVRANLNTISVGIHLVPNPRQILISRWGYNTSNTYRAGFRYPNGVTRPLAWAFWMCGYY
jgi:hypothetical protein